MKHRDPKVRRLHQEEEDTQGGYVGERYVMLTEECLEAMKLVAEKEG